LSHLKSHFQKRKLIAVLETRPFLTPQVLSVWGRKTCLSKRMGSRSIIVLFLYLRYYTFFL